MMVNPTVIYIEAKLMEDGGYLSKFIYDDNRMVYVYYDSFSEFEESTREDFPYLMPIE